MLLFRRATSATMARSSSRTLCSSQSTSLSSRLLTVAVSNLLESDVDWDEQSVRDELRAIVADVARLNNSIGALLDLSRLEARKVEQSADAVVQARDIGDDGAQFVPYALFVPVHVALQQVAHR